VLTRRRNVGRRGIVKRVALIGSIAGSALLLSVAMGASSAFFATAYLDDQQPQGEERPVASVDPPDHDEGAPSAPDASATEEESAFDLSAPQSAEAVFVQRATPRNILLNSTYLDHPSINGDPNAFILVQRASEPGGVSENNAHQIGVWYDAGGGGRWAIFNQHRAPMAVGATFKVVVLEGPNTMVHRATSQNTVGNSTYVDDSLTNGKPRAALTVTQNWNPGGIGNTYNDHPVGVRYDPDEKRWVIFNRDREQMPRGAAFNVAVLEDGTS
jgi:hypothetical protein